MFGHKRLAPCGGFGDSQGKICNDSTLSIYEDTLDKLMSGSRSTRFNKKDNTAFRNGAARQFNQSNNQNVDSEATGRGVEVLQLMSSSDSKAETCDRWLPAPLNRCIFCSVNTNATSRCSHCMKSVCNSCCRMCDGCEEAYCSVCTISNFEERYDRIFCFDCNAEDMKRRC